MTALLLAALVGGCEREGEGAHNSPAPAAADQAPLGPPPTLTRSSDPSPEAENCLPQAHAEFGEVPLDTAVPSFPWAGRTDLKARCTQECTFIWRDGVEYVADGEFVFQKYLYVDRGPVQAPLGLTAGVDMATAQAALARRGVTGSASPGRWRDNTGEEPPFEEGDVLVASLCMEGADINFHFDAKDRLRVIRLRVNTSAT